MPIRDNPPVETYDGTSLPLIRPEQLEKLPPCQARCPNGTDIRGWVGIIAQHRKFGITMEEAYTRAWGRLVEFNPLPASVGRICPHPCESACNRSTKDGAVAIHTLERFLGDWALAEELPLPLVEEEQQAESIGVIGSGPAGLSFAYQMARRGYPVTIYEKRSRPGGMLAYGIPRYRLPDDILAREIDRILALGVTLQLGRHVGKEVSVAALRERHRMLFFGIGAQRARRLSIPGEEGPGVWSGTTYLSLRKCGQAVSLGRRVAVIGGGNTAIDAARMARRDGAEVVLLYRRTRAEMPAAATEVDHALTENVKFEFLCAPKALIRGGDRLRALIVERMALGDADTSGRRRPVPVAGADYELEVNAVIVAVSQEPEWESLGPISADAKQVPGDGFGKVADDSWAGGDAVGAGIASLAIAQGRRAAEAVHASLRGLTLAARDARAPVTMGDFKPDYYAPCAPLTPPQRPSDQWLSEPDLEIDQTIDEVSFLREAERCFSCGLCFGCQQCWMYCNPSGYVRIAQVSPGAYFALSLDKCEGCGKCIEVCPCGFLSSAA
jgi:NADPH-dependent glutamate synthase beta subunit-like oxidoreductase/Pyruvate/2-oxoacid:ferredoxin oxidoreductase delta subunit